MTELLEELLRARFDELGVEPTHAAWIERLGGLDKGTFSRILRGALPLTQRRAKVWAHHLYAGDAEQAALFSQRLFESANRPALLSVSDFFEDMVAHDGVVPAERIIELFKALQAEELHNLLICCEYRDLPRAAPDSRYENMAAALGAAIANGLHFAMFQPFGKEIPLPITTKTINTPALNAALYMIQVKTKCIDAYNSFRSEAIKALDGNPELANSDESKLVLDRLNLYERAGVEACLGSGFQGKLFYLRYSTSDSVRHERIFQWLSTPKRDVLIYRGQGEITPEAIRDSFYPIPHFFDKNGRFPCNAEDGGVRRSLKDSPGGEGLPEPHDDVWFAYA